MCIHFGEYLFIFHQVAVQFRQLLSYKCGGWVTAVVFTLAHPHPTPPWALRTIPALTTTVVFPLKQRNYLFNYFKLLVEKYTTHNCTA